MTYYVNTTQTPNVLFDHLLKTLKDAELKVLLTVIRKSIGQCHPIDKDKRLERAWISQRLFATCCNVSRRSVSSAVDVLVQRGYVEVTGIDGQLLETKEKRRGASRLYYASRLRLEPNKKHISEGADINPVNKGHTIKLNRIKQSCYNGSQGVQRLSDIERYQQIQEQINTK